MTEIEALTQRLVAAETRAASAEAELAASRESRWLAFVGIAFTIGAFVVQRFWPTESGLVGYLMLVGGSFSNYRAMKPPTPPSSGGGSGSGIAGSLLTALAVGTIAIVPAGCATAQRAAEQVVDHQAEICALLRFAGVPDELVDPLCSWKWPRPSSADPDAGELVVPDVDYNVDVAPGPRE